MKYSDQAAFSFPLPRPLGGLARFVASVGAMIVILAASTNAQTRWWGMNTPSGGWGSYCYDPDRDRTVFFDGVGTYEFDSRFAGSWSLASWTSPSIGAAVFQGGAYDLSRQRIVYNDRGSTWEWNGSTWTIAAPFPPIWSFMSVVTHTGRRSVLAFGGPSEWSSNDLYEWTGTTWRLLPTTGRPPRPGDWNFSRIYLTSAYDARRDKLVVFGTALVDWQNAVFSDFRPDLWEWDSANGWVSRSVLQGSVERAAQLYFDSQRGVLTLITGYPGPLRIAEWDGGPSWLQIIPQTPLLPGINGVGSGSFDDVRGRFYVGLHGLNTSWANAYGSVNPPDFQPLAPGCNGTLGQPTLRLTHNWTRAWLGRSLSVDLSNLPLSAGIVALGWSDQQHGSTTLPLSLTPHGMPGCFARVAPDSVYFVTGAGNTATLALPVPNNPNLMGLTFYQQGWSFDPAANPTGMTTSNSARLTIGRL